MENLSQSDGTSILQKIIQFSIYVTDICPKNDFKGTFLDSGKLKKNAKAQPFFFSTSFIKNKCAILVSKINALDV